jgi:AraC-like DNA-binding protein
VHHQSGAHRTERIPRASGGISRLAYARLKDAGVAAEPLLKKAGLTLPQIEDANLRLSVRNQIEFLNLAAAALDDDYLGFHLAQTPDLRVIGLVYYVIASSGTLIEALQRAARYSSIVNEGVTQSCIDGQAIGLSLRYVGVSRHLDRHQMEFWMTALLRVSRQFTGMRLQPARMRLVHHRSRGSAEFLEFFGGDVEFGVASDEITFDLRTKELPLVDADPYLNQMLVRYCEEALSHRPNSRQSFRSKVENVIVPLLPHGNFRAGTIARKLGMSDRTFARRLGEEGLTFSELLEALRSDLANRYLGDDALAISQIAWLLGYREVGAFSNAFKRWTGHTPRHVRASSQAALPSALEQA